MKKLLNYLQSNRKRLGLSQEEVALLLGAQSGAKVSRYEQFTREPSLETALAFESILQKPVSELFAGLHEKVDRMVKRRAKALTHRTSYQATTPNNVRKLKALTGIAAKSKKVPKKP